MSLQQANEWTRSNTPLPNTTGKTSVEATDQGSDEACFVASEGKSHPHKLVPSTSLPTVPEVKRKVNTSTPAPPTNGAAVHHAAAASIECK